MVESPPPLVEQVPRHEDPPNLWVTLSAIAALVHVLLLGIAIPIAVRVNQAQVKATAPIPVTWVDGVDGDQTTGVDDSTAGLPAGSDGNPPEPNATAYDPQSGVEPSPTEANPEASEPNSKEPETTGSGTGDTSTDGSASPGDRGSGTASGDDRTAGTGDDSGTASQGEQGTTTDSGQTQGSFSGVVARFGVRSHPNGRDLPDQLPVLQQPIGTVQLLPKSACMTQGAPLGEGFPTETVTLQVLIEADGRLSQATVWQSSGNPTADALAECLVTTEPLQFQPALAGGAPIATDAVLLDVMVGGS